MHRPSSVLAGRKARSAVFAPEVPAIHVLLSRRKTWMPATSAGMTSRLWRCFTTSAHARSPPSRGQAPAGIQPWIPAFAGVSGGCRSDLLVKQPSLAAKSCSQVLQPSLQYKQASSPVLFGEAPGRPVFRSSPLKDEGDGAPRGVHVTERGRRQGNNRGRWWRKRSPTGKGHAGARRRSASRRRPRAAGRRGQARRAADAGARGLDWRAAQHPGLRGAADHERGARRAVLEPDQPECASNTATPTAPARSSCSADRRGRFSSLGRAHRRHGAVGLRDPQGVQPHPQTPSSRADELDAGEGSLVRSLPAQFETSGA